MGSDGEREIRRKRKRKKKLSEAAKKVPPLELSGHRIFF